MNTLTQSILALVVATPIFARTVTYSGSAALDDGKTFDVLVSFRTADAYTKAERHSYEHEERDWDVGIAEPLVCSRTLSFAGPTVSVAVRDGLTGQALVDFQRTVSHVAQLTARSAKGWVCPKWNDFNGYRGPLVTTSPGQLSFVVGKYRGSDLRLEVPSALLWRSEGRITGAPQSFRLHDLRLEGDDDTKTAWFSYRPKPNENSDRQFGDFKLFKQGQVARF